MKRGVIAIAITAVLAACNATERADLLELADPNGGILAPRQLTWIYTGHPETDWGDLSNAHFCRVNYEPPDSDHCMKAAGYVQAYR